MKRGLAGVGGTWRMRAMDRGSGDVSETGSAKGGKGKKSKIGTGASLTPDFRDKDESTQS